jgi:hypothetical protein
MYNTNPLLNNLGSLPSTTTTREEAVPVSTDGRTFEATQQLKAVGDLIASLEIPQSVKDVLSVNVSTVSQQERKPPSRLDKIEAIWNFWKFIEILDFHGGPVAFSACHRETVSWKFRPQALFKQLVLEPRGHLKSTLFCVAYTLWRIYQNPNVRIFVGTEGLKLSKAFIREIESYLVDDWLKQHVWNSRPHFEGPLIPEMDAVGKQRRLVKDVADEYGDNIGTTSASTSKKVWRAEAIQVLRPRKLKEPTVVAGSVGQTATGFHYDEVIFDDIVTFDNASTDTKIDKVFSWVYDIVSVLDKPYVDVELVSRFHSTLGNKVQQALRWAISGGRQTVIGTRYDDGDYYGHILENPDALGFETHVRNIYANGENNSDGYRWPEQWNEQVELETMAQFEHKYGTTGLKRYFSQYHNKIVDVDTSVLPWNKINFFNPASVRLDSDGFVTLFNLDGTMKAEFRPRLVLDPTSTSSERSDFAAIAVGGKYRNNLYVIDFWMKRCDVNEYLDKLYEFVDKWKLFDSVIEMVGGFKVLDTTIRNMWLMDPDKYKPIAIHPYDPGNQQSKYQRIETTLSPIVGNGLLHMPLYCSRNKDLQRQFTLLGKETVKDDGVDVISILEQMAFRFTRSSSQGHKASTNVTRGPFGGVSYSTSTSNSSAYYEIERRLNAA